jgi:hypothetical protein
MAMGKLSRWQDTDQNDDTIDSSRENSFNIRVKENVHNKTRWGTFIYIPTFLPKWYGPIFLMIVLNAEWKIKDISCLHMLLIKLRPTYQKQPLVHFLRFEHI